MTYFHSFLILTHVWIRGTYICLHLYIIYIDIPGMGVYFSP